MIIQESYALGLALSKRKVENYDYHPTLDIREGLNALGLCFSLSPYRSFDKSHLIDYENYIYLFTSL